MASEGDSIRLLLSCEDLDVQQIFQKQTSIGKVNRLPAQLKF